ncbi:MAG: zinc dependent phospholipase C family protein [Faecousia sp.]
MPAFYAHYRFGKQILSGLPTDVHQCIQRFRRLYDMGLQGPDFFFYYNPIMKTNVGNLGGAFHSQSGQEFFTRACTQANSEAARAYLYGLLGHYCLDSACHPFVDKMDADGEARHVALESEFDRYLMEKDGLVPPHTQDLSPHAKLTRGECVTVADFFLPATPSNVNRSVHFMAFSLRFLSGKNRKRVRSLLNSIKPSLCDSLIPEAPVESYARMDSELLARFNRAAKHYPVLLEQLTAHIRSGEPLGEDFALNFEGISNR